ncbi:MAG: signal peptidase II [Rhizomicrobium sp.]
MSRALLLLVIVLGCVGCDQVTKSAARAHLVPGEAISLLRGTVRLEYAGNPGAFLSLGESLPSALRKTLFTYGGLLLVAAAGAWALASKRMRPSQTLGAALICGGGMGNLIDRLGHGGYVTDFLNVGFGPLRTGIFNIADLALVAGLAIIVVSATRASRPFA